MHGRNRRDEGARAFDLAGKSDADRAGFVFVRRDMQVRGRERYQQREGNCRDGNDPVAACRATSDTMQQLDHAGGPNAIELHYTVGRGIVNRAVVVSGGTRAIEIAEGNVVCGV